MTIHEEYQMFDCTLTDLDILLNEQRKRGLDAADMAMSMVSDVQEMMVIGLDAETIRRALNRVKYILSQRSR